MVKALEYIIWLIVFIYYFNRSPIGNRNKEQKWPHLVEKWGDHDIPRIVSSDWFFWVAWSSRRAMPIICALTGVSLWNYITMGDASYLLPGPIWLAITILATSCFISYVPFAARPRRNPLDKWAPAIMSYLFLACGILVAILALIFHFIHIAKMPHSLLRRITYWANSDNLSDSLSIAGGLVGYGIALLGLIEALPSWRTKKNVVDNSEELEKLKLENEKLEKEIRNLRQRFQSKSRGKQPHRRRNKK